MKDSITTKRAPCPDLHPSPWTLPEVRIVVIYFVLASLWILCSDLWLTKSHVDETNESLIQSVKGLNFVITTAVLLFFVLRRAYGGWRRAEMQRRQVIELAREKFQKLSGRLQTLREEERTHIAREIHDQLGQLLTGIKMEVRRVENQLASRDDRSLNRAIDILVETSELVDTTIVAVQRISHNLRPSVLDNLGLGIALIEEASQFSQRTGIPCAMVVGELPENLPQDLATTAFRIYQESLTNVARHAEAQRIDSGVFIDDNVLVLSVHDDGKGIDPSVADDPKSLGLIGMIERAENVGGHVAFNPHLKKGTDVIFTVPLPVLETVAS